MKALAALANEESEADPRLEAVAHGSASDELLAALEAEAKNDPAFAVALEAHRPLDPIVAARIADVAVEAFYEGSPDNVVPIRSRRRFLAGGLVAAVAASAALVFIGVGGPAEPLPVYSMELIGGDATHRGVERDLDPEAETRPPARFSPGSRVELRLRPAVAVEGRVEARAFYVAGEATGEVAAAIDRSEQGAFRILGSADTLFEGHTGPARVILAVARPGALPHLAEAMAIANGAPARDDIQILEANVELVPGR